MPNRNVQLAHVQSVAMAILKGGILQLAMLLEEHPKYFSCYLNHPAVVALNSCNSPIIDLLIGFR